MIKMLSLQHLKQKKTTITTIPMKKKMKNIPTSMRREKFTITIILLSKTFINSMMKVNMKRQQTSLTKDSLILVDSREEHHLERWHCSMESQE
jgi:hypothetical protein